MGEPHPHLPNAEYFRRQAATCLRLAQFCRDLDVARRLFSLAEEFKTKAADLGRGPQPMAPRAFTPGDPPDAA